MRKGLFAAFFLVAIAVILAHALESQERPGSGFTEERYRFLEGQMPRGYFFSATTFRNCENGRWMEYTAIGDFYPLLGQCWIDRLPLYPEWMEPK